MLKDDYVRDLARKNRVKLFSDIMIKDEAHLLDFSGESDLFVKIGSKISEEFDKEHTYCEIDFQDVEGAPIKFPDAFECIVVDNLSVRRIVEEKLMRANCNDVRVYVSSLPVYRRR